MEMKRSDARNLMWAQACDLIEQAERMHRQFFRLSASARPEATWEPPADVFEDEREVAIVVALPGVAPDRVEVQHFPGTLVVRAERPPPFGASPRAIRRLEIPYGYFERRVALPPGRLEAIAHELDRGCLVVRLRKVI